MPSKLRNALALVLVPLVFACTTENGEVLAADSSKTTEEVRTEAATLERPELESRIAQYEGEITEATNELTGLKDKVAAMNPTELLSDAGAELKKQVDDLTARLDDLKAKLAVYQDALAKK
jgi:hypothetical protein